MKCKVDYELSEIREFTNDADKGHHFLKLVYTPANLGLAESFGYSKKDTNLQIILYPERDSENRIIEASEKKLIDGFINKKFEMSDVSRVSVSIPPTIMTYMSDGKNHQKGDPIMAGNSYRIYNSLEMVTFTRVENGIEVPINSNALISRALAMRAMHIEDGSWFDAEEGSLEEDNPNVIDDIPIEPQPQQRPQLRR